MENQPHTNYGLYMNEAKPPKGIKASLQSAREFFVYIKGDGWNLIIAFILVIVNSVGGVITPLLIAQALDNYIRNGNIAGLGHIMIILGIIYLVTVFAGYAQGMMMGGVSQRTLFRLRSALFDKLQDLPIAFFNQNKAGDLMSRLNNDTDKLNQFLSESLARFVGTFFVIFGIAIFALVINWKMALVMLAATLFLIIVTKGFSPWIERKNRENLKAVGSMSSSLQENLSNFRVIVAYNKRDYLRSHLDEASKLTFDTALKSGVAGRIFEPIYDFASSIALVAVLAYGLHLISLGQLSIGILVAFVSYTTRFYDPLRTMALIFSSIQLSVAAWSRIRAIFTLDNNLKVIDTSDKAHQFRMELKDVSFGYTADNFVIENANLQFAAGKTYALVGPTGGGKSTLASIMARLYDPTSGTVYLDGKDIRAYLPHDKAQAVSVILQDPILFSGSVADNIRYGNNTLTGVNDADLETMLKSKGFADVIARFPEGLGSAVSQGGGAGLSIGQKQLISFMRALLREPRLLILDEATANIDTVTEAILNKTLEALPKDTTKVIIAHRLNTIKEADEIMFVNGHHVTRAGDFHEAIKLIEHSKRTS